MIRFQRVVPKLSSSYHFQRAATLLTNTTVADTKNVSAENPTSTQTESQSAVTSLRPIKKQNLVDDAFANLGGLDKTHRKEIHTEAVLEKRLENAKDLESLMKISSHPGVTRKIALRILTTLGDWTSDKKIELSHFENDQRFLLMCRSLSINSRVASFSDLGTVLGVTGVDEAAKMISTASLGQMVRILGKLSIDKKRSPPLLRSLAFNISKCNDKLSIKQCADVLFAMSSLSFHDEILLVKTCSDACEALTAETKSSVVGSIARSLGVLKCRDVPLLDQISEWMVINSAQARSQDIVALLISLAIVDHQPANAENLWKVGTHLVEPLELPNSGFYLDAVWALLLLDQATHNQVACVLSEQFIDKLRNENGGELSVATTLKLLNVVAWSKLFLKDYKGPQVDAEALAKSITLVRSKEKAVLVNCVMDTLCNILPGKNHLERDIATDAGFIIDAECALDSNYTPLPVGTSNPGAVKIAVMVLGYHDTCIGARFRPNGVQVLARRLLEARGYRVLNVLHSEFNPSSKLVQRVKQLEQQLKALVAR